MSGERQGRRARGLRDDEHALWKAVTRSIKPLRKLSPEPSAPSAASAAAEVALGPLPLRNPDARPGPVKAPAPPPLVPLERRLRQRIAKGHIEIERRLDLHGLTQREAHDALVHFLHAAHRQGVRLALVVTGKGGRADTRDPFAERGVLRRLVPQWLKGSELRALVVGFEPAHTGHGGEGALYVRLRRQRGESP
jgi:DNA-nicking Smr family endonuclease